MDANKPEVPASGDSKVLRAWLFSSMTCHNRQSQAVKSRMPNSASDLGFGRSCGSAAGLDLAQTRLRTSSLVAVNQVLRGGLVQPFGGKSKSGVGRFHIATFSGFFCLTQNGSQRGSLDSVSQTNFFALSKCFFGCAGIWHLGERAILSSECQRKTRRWSRKKRSSVVRTVSRFQRSTASTSRI